MTILSVAGHVVMLLVRKAGHVLRLAANRARGTDEGRSFSEAFGLHAGRDQEQDS